MSGKKWKGKLLLLICLTAWLLFLLIQDRTHDAEEPPSGNGEELILPEPGVPESFKVLIKELQSLALDIKVLDGDGNEVILRETLDYDEVEVLPVYIAGFEDDELVQAKAAEPEDELLAEEEADEEETESDIIDEVTQILAAPLIQEGDADVSAFEDDEDVKSFEELRDAEDFDDEDDDNY